MPTLTLGQHLDRLALEYGLLRHLDTDTGWTEPDEELAARIRGHYVFRQTPQWYDYCRGTPLRVESTQSTCHGPQLDNLCTRLLVPREPGEPDDVLRRRLLGVVARREFVLTDRAMITLMMLVTDWDDLRTTWRISVLDVPEAELLDEPVAAVERATLPPRPPRRTTPGSSRWALLDTAGN